MSLFDEVDTLCMRDGNRCKRRRDCKRYMSTDRDGKWEADYWTEFGEFCNGFIPKTNND